MPGLHQNKLKTCTACGEAKIVSAFGRKAGGRASKCRDCLNARSRAFHAKKGPEHAQKMEAYQLRSHLKIKYGITPEVFAALETAQKNLCRICRQPETEKHPRHAGPRRLSVDHDHASGRLRGLLCRSCNRAIGGLKESPALLRAAAEYLEAAQRVADDTDPA